MAHPNPQKPVVHLHTHSEFSVRDGLSHLDDLCAAATADGQPAIAITDHGNMGGSWRLQKEADRAGIKPIFGCELYLSVGDRTSRATEGRHQLGPDASTGSDSTSERKYQHLTVLVESAEGWRNLLSLQSAAQDSYRSKPLADVDLLYEYHEGLIVLTGCLGGPVKSRLAEGDLPGAHAAVDALVNAFGQDRVYVEVMSHKIQVEDRMTSDLVDLAKEFGLGIVATNDSHFTAPGSGTVHDAWLCNGTKHTVNSPDRFKFNGEGYWLRTAAEMRAIFDEGNGTEKAVDTTLEIAERCTGARVMPEPHLRLPVFTPSADANNLLYDKVLDGARRLYGDSTGRLPAPVKDRLRYEVNIIKEKGLADYFLIVADMVSWARENGHLVGPGRGSAAGSCVSYCLGIIAVDPIAHGLMFERFLSPTRVGMPDIDTDFEYGARDAVVSYLAERWGRDRVARIGTYGTAQARAALQSAGRVLDQSSVGNKLSEAVPDTTGGATASLSQLIDPKFGSGGPFRALMTDSPVAREVVDIAIGFEGTIANEGVHACGVVIGDEPLTGVVPLRRDRTSGDPDRLVTEWDGAEMESAGFLKVDVLGVKNLSIVSGAVRLIAASTGEAVDPENASDDSADPRARAAWDLISAGHTDGIFQLESTGMTDLAMRIRPQSIAELAVIIALYRPGPMGRGMHDLYAERKVGNKKKSYDVFTNDPDEVAAISSVLDETLGIPVYQEQLMKLGEVVAGFGPVERDQLRHAVGKKVQEEMDEIGEMFLTGAVSATDMAGQSKQVFNRKTAEQIWDTIKSAADYAFNKAHSVGYAKLSYENAWLKANWPAAYAAAWLAVTTNAEKRLHVLSSLAREDVEVKGPDVNASQAETGLDADGAVRLGMGEIKGIGSNAEIIIAERESESESESESNGPFASLADLMVRVRVPISVVEGLIEAGACDSFGKRMGMLMASGALRGYPDTPIPDCEWGVVERAARERGRLGVTISTKPLVALADQLSQWEPPGGGHKYPVHKLPVAGSYISVVGILAGFTIIKKRVRFARLTLVGTHGSVNCVMWSDALAAAEQRRGGIPRIGSVIGVDARVQSQREFKRTHDDTATDTALGGESRPAEAKKELSITRMWSRSLDDQPTEHWPAVSLPAGLVAG